MRESSKWVIQNLLFVAIMTLAIITLSFGSCLTSANAKESGVSTEGGVMTIHVKSGSQYVIDTRFGLCFYETYSKAYPNNGVSVVQIDCRYFRDILDTK